MAVRVFGRVVTAAAILLASAGAGVLEGGYLVPATAGSARSYVLEEIASGSEAVRAISLPGFFERAFAPAFLMLMEPDVLLGERPDVICSIATIIRRLDELDTSRWRTFEEALKAAPLSYGYLCEAARTGQKMAPGLFTLFVDMQRLVAEAQIGMRTYDPKRDIEAW